MYVSYDPAARATYVKWEMGPVASTVAIGDLVNVDVDADGSPLGVEFLVLPNNVSQDMIDRVIGRFPQLKALGDLDRWVLPALSPSPLSV
jgi:uncharacterized protein YuzE